jgi:hypothetical protein
VRLKLTLLAGLAVLGAAGIAWAQQQPSPQPGAAPAGPVAPPLAPPPPEAEEAPPARTVAPPPPAKVEAEKPVEAAKPKAQTVEKAAEPLRRVRGGAAILQAIDTVTAETLRFEAPIGQPVRYKGMVITVRACETTAEDEDSPDSAAYMTIDSQPRAQPGRPAVPGKQVFKGWMFASSPGVNPLQHPVYDAWLISCRASGPAPAKR